LVQDIDEQIALLVARRDEMMRRQREELGRLCEKAGLLDIELDPEVLEAALGELAGRFRRQAVGDGEGDAAAAASARKEAPHE
jgi:hypothetical protein